MLNVAHVLAIALIPSLVADKGKSLRFADDETGCGIYRTCFECMPADDCSWNPDFGCISGGNGAKMCNPRDMEWNKQLSCPEINTCSICAEQSGCIWATGTCVYSRGEGCSNDPLNCANFKWQCSSKDDDGDNPDELEAIMNYAIGNKITESAADGVVQFLDLNQWDNTNDAEEGRIKQSAFCAPYDIYCTAAEMDPYNERNLAAVHQVLASFGMDTNGNSGTKYEFNGNYEAPVPMKDMPRANQPSWGYNFQQQTTRGSHCRDLSVSRCANDCACQRTACCCGFNCMRNYYGQMDFTGCVEKGLPETYWPTCPADCPWNQPRQTELEHCEAPQFSEPARFQGNSWFGGAEIDIYKPRRKKRTNRPTPNPTPEPYQHQPQQPTGPYLKCPQDVYITSSNAHGGRASFDEPKRVEGYVILTQLEGLPSHSFFPPGVTLQLFEATDSRDRTSRCSFRVIVSAP